MKWKALLVPALLWIGTYACATTQLKVPVAGDIAALAGRWEGEFSSRDGSRSGSIVFDLRAGQDTAYGDVLLVPVEMQRQHAPAGREGPQVSPELIGIRFVFVRDRLVRGTLEPYRDPVCGCRVHTVFNGALAGSTIEGTYRAYHVDTRETHEGSWLVRRSAVHADAGVHRDDMVRKAK